jgi:hypothetical protein
MAAFSEHAEIIVPFNHTNCVTLVDDKPCAGEHCKHRAFACHLGDDPDSFNERYCSACRVGLRKAMMIRQRDTHEKLKKRAEQGEHVFLFTGAEKGGWYEYQYVNTGEKFLRPETPMDDDAIQKAGDEWLKHRDDIKEREAKMFRTKQTKLTDFLGK